MRPVLAQKTASDPKRKRSIESDTPSSRTRPYPVSEPSKM